MISFLFPILKMILTNLAITIIEKTNFLYMDFNVNVNYAKYNNLCRLTIFKI